MRQLLRSFLIIVLPLIVASCSQQSGPEPYQLQVWQNSRRVHIKNQTVQLRKGPFELYFLIPDFPPDTARVVMFNYAGGFDAASVHAVKAASTIEDIVGPDAQRVVPDKQVADRLVLGLSSFATVMMNNPKDLHNFSGFRKEGRRLVLEYRLLGVQDDRLGELKFQDLTANKGALLFAMMEPNDSGLTPVLKTEKLFINFKVEE